MTPENACFSSPSCGKGAHLRRASESVVADERGDPAYVRVFCAVGIVQRSDPVAAMIEQFHG